jgi:hypothetical protein
VQPESALLANICDQWADRSDADSCQRAGGGIAAKGLEDAEIRLAAADPRPGRDIQVDQVTAVRIGLGFG